MTAIWLTYAWRDNNDGDIDHIIKEMQEGGIDVRYDRNQLISGQLLWDQIANHIADPEISAWVIYVSENSIDSRPCIEELAYALDRALENDRPTFRLIGLFNGNFDPNLMPAALKVRLCVNLKSNDWVDRVRADASGAKSSADDEPMPFGHRVFKSGEMWVVEVWPRTGSWNQALAAVAISDREKLVSSGTAVRNSTPTGIFSRNSREYEHPDQKLWVRVFNGPVDNSTSMYIFLNALPEQIIFGDENKQYGMKPWHAFISAQKKR
jgi:hypothetical protein